MPFDFDAFGNPLEKPANRKPRSAASPVQLHSDGFYDPAIAPYYRPVQPHGKLSGLFTSFEGYQGQIPDPASLAKFMYAGQTPVDCIDPA